MHLSNLSTTEIAFIAFALVVAGGVVVWLLQRRRTTELRSRFGEAEYERALNSGGDRRHAEAQLENRKKRVESFHLRELSYSDRARFVSAWTEVQAHFVDTPAGAVTDADRLVGDLMSVRGYPVTDFEQRAADISVDHPIVTQNYRAAHEIAIRHMSGQATTEDLRRAMIHYRALFDDLLGESKPAEDRVVVEPRTDYAGNPSFRTR